MKTTHRRAKQKSKLPTTMTRTICPRCRIRCCPSRDSFTSLAGPILLLFLIGHSSQWCGVRVALGFMATTDDRRKSNTILLPSASLSFRPSSSPFIGGILLKRRKLLMVESATSSNIDQPSLAITSSLSGSIGDSSLLPSGFLHGNDVRASFVRGPPPETRPDFSNIHGTCWTIFLAELVSRLSPSKFFAGPLGAMIDYWFLRIFRDALSKQVFMALAQYSVSARVPEVDYSTATADDIYSNMIDLTHMLNRKIPSTSAIQYYAQQTLVSLFPKWLPPQYKVLFSRPFPEVRTGRSGAVR
jgi:hypothetical protein